MINFLTYLFYRLTLYYNNQGSRFHIRANAYFSFCFILFVHQMTIEFFLDGLFLDSFFNRSYFSHDKYTRRFIIAPLVALPVFLLVYFYYWFNKKKVNDRLKEYSQETEEASKQGKKRIIIYFVCSLLLLIVSVLSSKWF